jgi:hypothetical protein
MNKEEAETMAEGIQTRWEKVNYLEEELKKENKLYSLVGKLKLELDFESNFLLVQRERNESDYKAYLSSNKWSNVKHLNREENGSYKVSPVSAWPGNDNETRIKDYSNVSYTDPKLKNVLSMAIMEMFPAGERIDEKELEKATKKIEKHWIKTNVLEGELKRQREVTLIANKKRVVISFSGNELEIINMDDHVYSDDIKRSSKLVRSFDKISFLVQRSYQDNYLKRFNNGDLSGAIRYAMENIVVPECSIRSLSEDFDLAAWFKPTRSYEENLLFEKPKEWKNKGSYVANFGENPIFCFMPAKRNEGILFELKEEYSQEDNEKRGQVIGISAGDVYRFLVPQTLNKIYNLEYKTLKQTTHCCSTQKALLIQCELDKKLSWQKPYIYKAALLHKLNGFNETLKGDMGWLIGKWEFISPSKMPPKKAVFEGIIAVPGGKAEKMNFAAVFVGQDGNKVKQTFIKPISSRGAVVERDNYPYEGLEFSAGIGLSERAKMEKIVSKVVQTRMNENLDKTRKACSQLVYSKRVLDVLGD